LAAYLTVTGLAQHRSITLKIASIFQIIYYGLHRIEAHKAD